MVLKFVKPRGDAKIRKPLPDGRHLDAAGEMVEWSTYWARRQQDGMLDVADQAPRGWKPAEVTDPNAEPPAAPAK